MAGFEPELSSHSQVVLDGFVTLFSISLFEAFVFNINTGITLGVYGIVVMFVAFELLRVVPVTLPDVSEALTEQISTE